MAGLHPVAAYSLRIPPGDILVPVVPGFQAMARITMAAIDPSEEPELDSAVDKQKVRSTLKVVRVMDDEFSDDEDDYEDVDDEDSDEDGAAMNGASSSKIPSKKDIARAIAEAEAEDDDEEDDEDMEDGSDDEAAAQELLARLMKDAKKGKSKAVDGEEDDSEDDEAESMEMDEVVVCTLDPEKAYQQPLDLVFNEGEKVFFKVSGNLTVHITGNYIMPLDEPSDDEDDADEDYGEDELDALDALVDGGEESDDLDDLDDPRVMEVDSEEEKPKTKAAPASTGKGKNKRPAEDSAEEEVSLDNIMAKSLKQEESAESKKLSKADKKKQKKLKNNEGEAAAAPQTNGTPDSGKKTVQFAKNLEQGPTPSGKPEPKTEAKAEKKSEKTDTKADAKADSKKSSISLGVKTVNGVSIDDRKIGTGPAAKKGSKVEMRYIGKLKDGKVFDSNKSGKPFAFKLGAGEVIKGWDIGIMGLSAGGERRLTIPANLGYGKTKSGPIPANSELTFDVKCISVK